jgi:hypothetical protein
MFRHQITLGVVIALLSNAAAGDSMGFLMR